MEEALSSSETLVLTRATRRKIPENNILNVPILLRSVRRWLVTASVIPISPILVTPMKEAQSTS
jgi:hypothetical protein